MALHPYDADAQDHGGIAPGREAPVAVPATAEDDGRRFVILGVLALVVGVFILGGPLGFLATRFAAAASERGAGAGATIVSVIGYIYIVIAVVSIMAQ